MAISDLCYFDLMCAGLTDAVIGLGPECDVCQGFHREAALAGRRSGGWQGCSVAVWPAATQSGGQQWMADLGTLGEEYTANLNNITLKQSVWVKLNEKEIKRVSKVFTTISENMLIRGNSNMNF